jgi:hypothetical protein
MYQVRGDQYAWVPCRVVRWDEEARAFEVEFGDGSRSSDSGRIADSRYDGGAPESVTCCLLVYACCQPLAACLLAVDWHCVIVT